MSFEQRAGRPRLAARRGFVLGAIALATSLTVSLPAQGPDVTCSDLQSAKSWGTDGSGIYAYSIGTVACNVGDEEIAWVGNTAEHPCIAQNLYRYRDGRFEQIGLSWVKHGIFALQLPDCGLCAASGTPSLLGVGCSDPYSASGNGQQTRLGPRSVIDVRTGSFPFPIGIPDYDPVIGRRLQVAEADVDPALNVGATYVAEAQYVAADDALAGNALNNVTHRYATIADDTDYTLGVTGPVQATIPAIYAWQDLDPEVTIVEIDVPDDGRLILGYRVTQSAADEWSYEYALYNQTSGRCAKRFELPLPLENFVVSTGFHDVDTHSDEPFSTIDWSNLRSAESIIWTTDDYDLDVNANALRWGMLYNYRVVTNAPPVLGEATIELFEPGTPNSVTVPALVPTAALAGNVVFIRGDVNMDGTVDIGDALAGLGYLFLESFGPPCLDAVDSDDSGSTNIADVVWLLTHLFSAGPSPALPFPDCGPDPTTDSLHCVQSSCI